LEDRGTGCPQAPGEESEAEGLGHAGDEGEGPDHDGGGVAVHLGGGGIDPSKALPAVGCLYFFFHKGEYSDVVAFNHGVVIGMDKFRYGVHGRYSHSQLDPMGIGSLNGIVLQCNDD
jgi:hypothetical protein